MRVALLFEGCPIIAAVFWASACQPFPAPVVYRPKNQAEIAQVPLYDKALFSERR